MKTEVVCMYTNPVKIDEMCKGDIVKFTYNLSNVTGLVIRKEKRRVRILSMLVDSKEHHCVMDFSMNDSKMKFIKINQMTEIDTEVYNNKYNSLARFQSFTIELNNSKHLNF